MTANGGAGSQAVQVEHGGRKLGSTLSQQHIIHVGIFPRWTPIPRDCSHPAITYFLAGFRGKGRVRMNDHWQLLKPNYACWLPANANYAFEAMPGSGWTFCWVCYNLPQLPIGEAELPHLAPFETLPLHSAIAGLLHECNGPRQPCIIQEWTGLVHAYVLSFVGTGDH